jgi:hypothetical protein
MLEPVRELVFEEEVDSMPTSEFKAVILIVIEVPIK